MARIPMRSGFTLIPEGRHKFVITKVDYDERFGKLVISLRNQKGLTHTERFSLLSADGKTLNEKALNAFSYLAKTALQRFDLGEEDEIDPQELVGCYIEADIEHNVLPKKDKEGNEIPGQTTTFARMGDKFPCDDFEEGTSAPQTAAPAPAAPAKRSWL